MKLPLVPDNFFKKSRFGELFKKPGIEEYLPYGIFDSKHHLFFNDDSVGFVLEGIPFVGINPETQRQIMALFQYDLPAGASIQFHLRVLRDTDEYLDRWYEARSNAKPILQKMSYERKEFLKHHKKVRNFELVISVSFPLELFKKMDIKAFHNMVLSLKASLDGFGMPSRFMGANDLMRWGHKFWGRKLEYPYDSMTPLAPQMMPHGIEVKVKPDCLEVDENKTIQSFTVKKTANHWYLNAMNELIGDLLNDNLQIPGEFMFHYGVHIINDTKTKVKIGQRQSVMDYQASVPNLRKYIPSLDFQIAEWDFVRSKFDEGQRLVNTRFQVVLWSNNDDERIEQEAKLLNLFRNHRWHLEKDRFIELPSLLSTWPMTWGAGGFSDSKLFKKCKTTLSYEPANLLPILGEWKGTKTPSTLLVGRRGQLMSWHPFDNTHGNYNVCVVGRSGSGKSVFMQDMIMNMVGLGGRVRILDVGRSFEKTVKLLDGSFLEFSSKGSLSINPFTSMPESGPESHDALAMLKSVLSLMAAPNLGTNDHENSLLEKALMLAWEDSGRDASITLVAKFLAKQKDPVATRLSEMLSPYTESGLYGRFFKGPANLDLSNPVLLIELEELKERKDLQSVVVQMLILQIMNEVYLGDRMTNTALVLDEAWDMLRGSQSGLFIETAARRLRKYGGSLITGTQSVNDFYATPGAQVAFENSDWMCLLSQKKESLDQLKKSGRLSMDGGLEEILRSLHTKQGEYSEIAIVGPSGYAIGRLMLDPFSSMLFSTKADEYAQIQKDLARGLSIEESIRQRMRA